MGSDQIATDAVGADEIAVGAVGTSEAPTFVNSTVENLKVIRGIVDTASTTPIAGSGFTVGINATGDVTITFTAAFSARPSVTAMGEVGTANRVITIDTATAPSESVIRIQRAIAGGAAEDGVVHFIAIGPR